MLQDESLPLAGVIEDKLFQSAFEEFDVNFGDDDEAVYSPALTLWAFVSQAFYAGTGRSLKGAVSRVASWWAARGHVVDSDNTGAYSRARAKIPFELIATLTRRIAERCEAAVDWSQPTDSDEAEQSLTPRCMTSVRSVPVNGRIVLIDGFTVDAADTPENQEEFPQNPAQTPGLGFPMIRCLCLISLATGMLHDLAIGPYAGKETGETALLRSLLESLRRGDVIVADCYHCTYWLLAECAARGIDVVMKNHHKREDHPDDAFETRKGERLAFWTLPPRPSWMSQKEYAAMPEEIIVRLVDIQVQQKGFRSEGYTVATTLMDDKVHNVHWLGGVYCCRWFVELDIRAIKCTLNMEHLRCKTPDMVRAELWSCLLAYNLVRMKMLQSGIASGREPRSLSFSAALTQLTTTWLTCAIIGVNDALIQLGQNQPLTEPVGQRPDRVEPRANKRRPKVLALLKHPRQKFSPTKAAT